MNPAAIAPQKFCHGLTLIFTDAEKTFCKSVFHPCSSVARNFLEDDRFAFGHDEHFVFDSMCARGCVQALEWFFHRLVTKAKGSVMHRHERLRIQLLECDDRLLGIHVHLAIERRFVRANRQERDLDIMAFADFLEALEIGGVAAMKNGAPVRTDDETTKAAMCVGEKTRAPMMRGRQRHAQRAELDCLPFAQLVDNVESQPVNQTPDANWNDDRLVGGNESQRAAIEMIEVRVCDEDEIDRGQMMDVKARFFESLDDAEPHRPDRIDQNVCVVRLDQK